MPSSHSVTLVLGGARSGKSSFAQRIAQKFSPVAFIATAQATTDDEMRRRIERHRADRPTEWTTIEEAVALDDMLVRHAQHYAVLIIDCLTIYTANLMSAERDDADRIIVRASQLCEKLRELQTSVVLVSNEVGSGVVPAFASGRLFRDLLGEINQRVAEIADNVFLMTAGLPQVLKGRYPDFA